MKTVDVFLTRLNVYQHCCAIKIIPIILFEIIKQFFFFFTIISCNINTIIIHTEFLCTSVDFPPPITRACSQFYSAQSSIRVRLICSVKKKIYYKFSKTRVHGCKRFYFSNKSIWFCGSVFLVCTVLGALVVKRENSVITPPLIFNSSVTTFVSS